MKVNSMPTGYFCMFFLSSADFFFQVGKKAKIMNQLFRITIRVSNGSDSDQAWRFVGPDLDTNCLQRLSADDTYRQ